MKKYYNKLVRDKIPEIILEQGNTSKTKILSQDEYIKELALKLKEEVIEFLEDLSLEELADVTEVINCLKKALNVDEDNLEQIRKNKNIKNGGFDDKIYLEYIDYSDK